MADSRVASPATHMEPIPPSIDGKGGRKFSSSQAVLFQDAAKPGAVETERASSLYTSDAVDESKSHVLDEDGGASASRLRGGSTQRVRSETPRTSQPPESRLFGAVGSADRESFESIGARLANATALLNAKLFDSDDDDAVSNTNQMSTAAVENYPLDQSDVVGTGGSVDDGKRSSPAASARRPPMVNSPRKSAATATPASAARSATASRTSPSSAIDSRSWISLSRELTRLGFPPVVASAPPHAFDVAAARVAVAELIEVHTDQREIINQLMRDGARDAAAAAARSDKEWTTLRAEKDRMRRSLKQVRLDLLNVEADALRASQKSKEEMRGAAVRKAALRSKVQTLEHSVRARDATIKSLQARLKKEIERAQSRAGRARERIRDSTGSSPAAAVPQAEALRLARLYTQRNDDLKRQLEKSRQQLKSTQSALEDTHLKLQAALRGGRERREGESVTAAAYRKNNDQLKRVISRMDAEAAEAARRVRKAEEDAAELRIELENRPTAQDYQKAQRTIFNLQSKISAEEDAVEEERRAAGPGGLARADRDNQRLGLDKLSALSKRTVVRHLQAICRELELRQPEQVVPALRKMSRVIKALPGMERFIRAVCRKILSAKFAPRPAQSASVLRDAPGILERWDSELGALAALREFEKTICRALAARRGPSPDRFRSGGAPRDRAVAEVQALVKTEAYAQSGESQRRAAGEQVNARPDILSNRMVAHFMKLFSVSTVTGVFPKMNSLYLRVSELDAFLKSAKKALALDPATPAATTLSAARRKLTLAADVAAATAGSPSRGAARAGDSVYKELVNEIKAVLSRGVREVHLGTVVETVQLVVNRLMDLETALPGFESLVSSLMELLNVKKIDDIIPSVGQLVRGATRAEAGRKSDIMQQPAATAQTSAPADEKADQKASPPADAKEKAPAQNVPASPAGPAPASGTEDTGASDSKAPTQGSDAADGSDAPEAKNMRLSPLLSGTKARLEGMLTPGRKKKDVAATAQKRLAQSQLPMSPTRMASARKAHYGASALDLFLETVSVEKKALKDEQVLQKVLERWDTLVRAWGDMDANKDGVITFAEFQTGLKNSGLTVELDQAQRIWKAMDTSEDNEVSYDEFKAALQTGREEKKAIDTE